jgi:hypothetical protein
MLVAGQADSALVRVEPRGESAPEDDLLRALYGGILAHYAGDYDSSSASLQEAADLADDRYTKRISRTALSLVTNDKALPYEPAGTERLLIHYYAALNYLRQENAEGAAVEARRLSALLERADSPGDSALVGWLRYFSGVVFEAAGERNDAEVAYRNAALLLGPGGAAPERERVERGSGLGEVVVLVEEGFVAHRVEQAIVVPLYSFELDRLGSGETGGRLTAAAAVATRVFAQALVDHADNRHLYYDSRPRTINVAPLPRAVVQRECEESTATKGAVDLPEKGTGKDAKPPKQPDPAPIAGPGTVTGSAGGRLGGAAQRSPARSAAPRRSSRTTCADTRNPYLLKIAWPVFRQDRIPAYSLQVVTDVAPVTEEGAPLGGSPDGVAQLRMNLSNAVARDFDGERSAILTRTILRGVTKAVVTRSIERAPGEDAEGVGRLLGALVNLGTALLEQADTRSWQLLPNQVRMIRLQLPPGEHEIAVEVRGTTGAPERIDLGSVQVTPGGMEFLSTRIWR